MIVLIILSLVLIVRNVNAQRQLPGMKGIQLMAETVDGFYHITTKNRTGYIFGASLSTYIKGRHQWVFGGEYLRRYYPYRDTRIPIEHFTVTGGFLYSMLSDRSRTVCLSAGISALVGYETVNGGQATLSDGATLRNKDTFIYGGTLSLQTEIHLTDCIILLLTARERILGGTTTGHFHTLLGAGIKFIIN